MRFTKGSDEEIAPETPKTIFPFTIETLDEFLSTRFGKEARDGCAVWALESPEHLDAIWKRFIKGVDQHPALAAWVLDKVCDLDREQLRSYLPELIARLDSFQTDWERRSSMRMLAAFKKYPSKNLGHLLDIAIEWFANPQVAIAIRVHSMQVAYNISLVEPDIKQELAQILEIHLDELSSGFKSRASKLLKKLRK
jgi:hypothetical protein